MRRRLATWVSVTVVLLFFIVPLNYVWAAEKWQGVDESVVERVAKEHGREAHKPLINTDQGIFSSSSFLSQVRSGALSRGTAGEILWTRGAGQKESQGQAEKQGGPVGQGDHRDSFDARTKCSQLDVNR